MIDLDLEQGSWEVIYGRHKFKKYTLFTHQIESDALVRFWKIELKICMWGAYKNMSFAIEFAIL